MEASKKLIDGVTIGCDPEMFLYSKEKGKYVPVCGLVGGTKDSPIPITDEGHAVQEDNVMVEYCIPPCSNVNDFVKHIKFTKDYIDETILSRYGLVSKCVASARFDYDDLQAPQALHFGCSPDYNAWTLEQNEVSKGDPLLRTAGGHIHVGYDDPDARVSIELIKAMDLFIGVPSIILDTDTDRRRMYGKAGAYRLKGYGAEYRVVSNFWTNNEELMKWVWGQVIKAIDWVNHGGIITNPKDIVNCINHSDKDLAIEIIEDYHIEIPGLVDAAV
jgi:hypothetical protein